MPELNELVVTLGRHSVLVLVAGSASVATVSFVLKQGAVVDAVAVLAVY